MSSPYEKSALKLLPTHEYKGVDANDPIRFYRYPFLGQMYRRRVSLCLEQCRGGERVLEIGFGSGVAFLNLAEHYKEVWGLDRSSDTKAVESLFLRHGIHPRLFNGNILCMPYEDNFFDTVLLISILEHLKPPELKTAFSEICRVLRTGGQAVFGVPVERAIMRAAFFCLGYDIRKHHFSTHDDVLRAAACQLARLRVIDMKPVFSLLGPVYKVGHFVKPATDP